MYYICSKKGVTAHTHREAGSMETKITECSKCKGKSKSQVFITTDEGFVCLECLINSKQKEEDV